MQDESAILLRRYVEERAQDAFAQIVRRYVDMVYAAARRQVRDAELAQDVTQAVFIVLAQRAGTISTDRPLSAWLLRTTTYCASNARRAREHRQLHERKAAEMARDIYNSPNNADADWEALAPLLDEGLHKLGAGERDALILKYFEKKSLRQVGEALGISEDAATKRVSRALERLRVFFQRRGTAVSAIALATLLASESAKAAPIGLAGAISAGAGTAAAGTGAASVAKGAMLVMSTEKLKLAGIGAAALIVAVIGILVVKSAHSPKPHTALVPFQPVVQKSFTKSLWALTFTSATQADTNSTQVEILGICDPDAKTPLWWAADGSEAFAPNIQPMPQSKFDLNAGEVKRCIVMRLSGPSLGAKGTEFLKELDPAMRGESVSSDDSSGQLIRYTVAVPSNVNSASLKFTLKIAKKRPEEVTISNVVLMPTGQTADVRILRGPATRPALTRAGS